MKRGAEQESQRRRVEPRSEQKCSVCGWDVPDSGDYNSGSVGLVVSGKLVSSTCTCGAPTFTEGSPAERPAHWPAEDDPYAYYKPWLVPRWTDLQRPGKQKFTGGEMKGKTFKEVYHALDFSFFGQSESGSSSFDGEIESDDSVAEDAEKRQALVTRRASLEKAYAGTEEWRRFRHYVDACRCCEMHLDIL